MQFIKKTSSRTSIVSLFIKMSLILVIIFGIIFFLNKLEFPAPKKEIEKIISNENFKVVK
tara:strand:+ start:40 stop:219 length:180 start_codon:yes stop_codon:yes gene_type:complete